MCFLYLHQSQGSLSVLSQLTEQSVCVCVCVCLFYFCENLHNDVPQLVLACYTSRSAQGGRTWCPVVSKATTSPCCCSTLTPVGHQWYCRRAPTPVPAPTRSWNSHTAAAAKLVTTAKTQVQRRALALPQILNRGVARSPCQSCDLQPLHPTPVSA